MKVVSFLTMLCPRHCGINLGFEINKKYSIFKTLRYKS